MFLSALLSATLLWVARSPDGRVDTFYRPDTAACDVTLYESDGGGAVATLTLHEDPAASIVEVRTGRPPPAVLGAYQLGCEGEPGSWHRLSASQPRDLNASEVATISAQRSADCTRVTVGVLSHTPGYVLTSGGERQYVAANGTAFHSYEWAPASAFGVWFYALHGEASAPVYLQVPRADRCEPEPIFVLDWAEDERAYLGVLSALIVLCYYQGIYTGFWSQHTAASTMFHALLLQTHIALLSVISFGAYTMSMLVAAGVALTSVVLDAAWRYCRDAGRPYTHAQRRRLGLLFGFMVIQLLFLAGLAAMGA